MRTGMLITLTLFSIGCSENDLGDLKDISNPSDMDIEVSPAALDFGILSHGVLEVLLYAHLFSWKCQHCCFEVLDTVDLS